MSRNFPFQHCLKPSMEKTPPREEEQLEFDKLNEPPAKQEFNNYKSLMNEDLEELAQAKQDGSRRKPHKRTPVPEEDKEKDELREAIKALLGKYIKG